MTMDIIFLVDNQLWDPCTPGRRQRTAGRGGYLVAFVPLGRHDRQIDRYRNFSRKEGSGIDKIRSTFLISPSPPPPSKVLFFYLASNMLEETKYIHLILDSRLNAQKLFKLSRSKNFRIIYNFFQGESVAIDKIFNFPS